MSKFALKPILFVASMKAVNIRDDHLDHWLDESCTCAASH